jgi:hypothetical protein
MLLKIFLLFCKFIKIYKILILFSFTLNLFSIRQIYSPSNNHIHFKNTSNFQKIIYAIKYLCSHLKQQHISLYRRIKTIKLRFIVFLVSNWPIKLCL